MSISTFIRQLFLTVLFYYWAIQGRRLNFRVYIILNESRIWSFMPAYKDLTGAVPDEMDFSNLPSHYNGTIALGSTQPLTEMSTRNLPGGKMRPARRADKLAAIWAEHLKMWEPKTLATLRASTACTRINLSLPLPQLGQTVTQPCLIHSNLECYYYPFCSVEKFHQMTYDFPLSWRFLMPGKNSCPTWPTSMTIDIHSTLDNFWNWCRIIK
jgi:hypothetical protein